MTGTEIGAHRSNDPRGWLVFESLPDALQAAEDSTQANDHHTMWLAETPIRTRPSTTAERQLLAHLGYTVTDDLLTRVEWLSNGVRNRRWLALEGQHP